MTATVQRYTNREGKIGFKVVSPYLCKETNKQKSKIRKFNPSVEFASYSKPKQAAKQAADAYCAKVNKNGHAEFFSEYVLSQGIAAYQAKLKIRKEGDGIDFSDYSNIEYILGGPDGKERDHLQTTKDKRKSGPYGILYQSSIANTAVKDINDTTVDLLIRDLVNKEFSDDKISKVIKQFKNVIDCCVQDEIVSFNSIRGYKFRAIQEVREVTKVEIPQHKDIKILEEKSTGLDHVIYTTCPYHGMRWSEWACLKWDDINPNTKKIKVRRFLKKTSAATWVETTKENSRKKKVGKTKNSIREIPLFDNVAAALRRWHDNPASDDTYVYGINGTWANYNSMRQRLNTIKKQNKITFVGGVHSFRHYYASFLIESIRKQACNELQMAQWLGHSDPGFTKKVYAKIFDDDPDAWVQRIDKFSDLYNETKAA